MLRGRWRVACGGEVKEDANAGGDKEVLGNSADDKPVVTEAPTVESTPAPADEPTTEVTPKPTEEPKIVVFSDETGRKEIFENDSVIKVNPDTDMIGVYLPEGYTRSNMIKGIKVEYAYDCDYFYYCKLKPEETREKGKVTAAFYVEYNSEEVKLSFVFKPE